MQRTPLRRHVILSAGVVIALAAIATALAVGAPPASRDRRPAILVNQIGYMTDGPKRATLISDSPDPLVWQLRDGDGATVGRGRTTPRGDDPAAGLMTHTIDFSGTRRAGDGYTLTAGDATSVAFDVGVRDDYAELSRDAANYFYAARSGIAIDAEVVGEEYARPAGHDNSPADGRANQGDLDVPCQSLASQTDDQGRYYYGAPWECPDGYALDVVGGWYDAGDHGKYVVTGAFAAAHLLSTHARDPEAFGDGSLDVPEAGNGVPDLLDEARWELEWMLSMQVPEGTPPFLVDGEPVDLTGMLHHKVHDESWAEMPLLPHENDLPRSLHRPSTAATLTFAAAAAQGSRLWERYDGEFAERLLEAAERAYAKARTFPTALYAPAAAGAEGGGPYGDDAVADEFYWASAELYLTTRSRRYGELARYSPRHAGDVFPDHGYTWSNVAALGRLSLATVANDLADRDETRASVVAAADELLEIRAEQSMGHPYAGVDGRYEWGSNGQLLNNLVVLATAYDLTGEGRYRDAVIEGVDYLFGRNALGWSYVTGYGAEQRTSENQHSRWWAAQLDGGLPHPPPGTLAGGPNSDTTTWDPLLRERFRDGDCAPQQCYVDDIESWATNELAVNWNAALVRVASFVADPPISR